jgi:hypothetical protein
VASRSYREIDRLQIAVDVNFNLTSVVSDKVIGFPLLSVKSFSLQICFGNI